MTWVYKHKPMPGGPVLCEYECSKHGGFELLVSRDANGDPPEFAHCSFGPDGELLAAGGPVWCILAARRIISAPNIKFWSRDPTAINPPGACRKDKPDPRALDTSGLASGKQTRKEWNAMQKKITLERRYQKRLASGKISKRIQVG